ncbi:hypothetical protein MOV63_14060 [Neorhizobium sp. SHOUNA12A]|nr:MULTISPECIES: hypothetical protein [unclassified Neorhizobium]MCJ9669438.1 hypothetical protein [Neorhizobium sp. SHOUNA12B]MCJ9745537.1 hypothetical protein [Neorhizobium sp. SHOUNA12A]
MTPSPRFAIASTPAQMETTQALVQEFPDLHIQTHLPENHDEIRYTCELFPEAINYTDIYARYGLLVERLDPLKSFNLMTRGNAEALSMAGASARLTRAATPIWWR